MRKLASTICSFATSIVLALACVPVASAQETDMPAEQAPAYIAPIPADPQSYVPGELVVTVDPAEAGVPTAIEQQVDAVESVEDACIPGGTAVKVDLDGRADVAAAQAQIARVDGVESVQPNYRYRASSTTAEVAVSDTYAGRQYYLESGARHGANVRAAWSVAKTNSMVTVAVLDTGFKGAHEDLTNTLDKTNAYDAYKGAKLTNWTDAGKHGTHVAGIIAAAANNGKGVAGVSYNARVLPIKVFDDSGEYCTTSSLIRAYNYMFKLRDSGAVPNLRVANMSLGGYGSSYGDRLLEGFINKARNTYGIVTVCSGGNGDDQNRALTTPSYPSDFDACVSVTSLEADGSNSPYSDYNKYKDISAPGARILSTYPTGNSSYEYCSGTSMSAPVVSGVFALLWAANPQLSVSQACSCIYNTAVPVVDSRYDRRATSGSHGCIDAAAAVSYAKGVRGTQSIATGATAAKPQTSTPGVKVGTAIKTAGANAARYAVTGTATVRYVKFAGSAKAKTVTVPASIRYRGKTFAVTEIAASAFRNAKKCRTLKIKTRRLTKSGVKGALKGSRVKVVKAPTGKRAAYKKAFAKKNAGRSVKVK